MEEDDWARLPIIDKISHKAWKARVQGYDELNKKIPIMEIEELKIYCDIVKKAPLESNAAALDKALECVLSYIQNAPSLSERIVSECVCGVATKAMGARPKSKQLGFGVCLQFVENEVSASVIEELLKVVSSKNPKIVNGSCELILLALKEFGAKVIDIKPIVKTLPKYLAHNDKNVRNNAKAVAVECYYYLGDAIKPVLADIQPLQMKELEEEFSKLRGKPPPCPPRKIRSQQQQHAQNSNASTADFTANDNSIQDDDLDIVDPYDLLDPVDILPLIPADFYSKITDAKWQIRKEALESIVKAVQSPKIAPGNFSNLVGSLKKVISSDVNVNVCLMAINATGCLAKGLKCNFDQYCSTIVPALFDRFKEKKPNIVAALKDTVDACSSSWAAESVISTLTPYYDHKVPSIREECIKYVSRFLSSRKPSTITKPMIKCICKSLVKRMDDSVGPVREAAAEVLAVLMKIAGEKVLNAFLEGQLDDIKKNKVKSLYQKLTGSASSENCPSGASASKPTSTSTSKLSSTHTNSTSRTSRTPLSATTTSHKPTSNKSTPTTQTKKDPPKNPYENDSDEPAEPDVEENFAFEQCIGSLLNNDMAASLGSSVWKDRLECVETIGNKIALDPNSYDPRVIFRVLSKKPGWRDGNLQVFKLKLCVMSQLVVASTGRSVTPFSRRAAHNLIPVLADKYGDVKMRDAIRSLLIQLAEAVSLNFVSVRLAHILQSTKSVKVQSEILNWINDMLVDFGLKIDLKPHVQMLKFALDQINPEVKKCAVHLAVRMYVYIGAAFKTLLADVKPAQMTQIENDYSQLKCDPIPKPTRGIEATATHHAPSSSTDQQQQQQDALPPLNLEDLIERVDVSNLICGEWVDSLEDKNWKIRTEALDKINDIFKARKPVKATSEKLTPLVAALICRLQDNNKNIIVHTLNICAALIESIGPTIYEQRNTLFREVLSCLSDSKPSVHAAAISTLDSWNATVPIHLTLSNEPFVVAEMLSIDNPNIRVGILTYLVRSFESVPDLPRIPTVCVEAVAKPFFRCLVDRKIEVRKAAQQVAPFLLKLSNPDSMKRMAANDLDKTTQNTVLPLLEQALKGLKLSPTTQSETFDDCRTNSHPTASVVENVVTLEEVEMEEDIKPSPPSCKQPQPARLKYVAGSKKIREQADSTGKIIQWSFGSLKPHYITHLKELMSPYVEQELLDGLFHADFKNHITAAQTLSEICSSGSEEECDAYFECFDLVLKWCVIKLFESNPVVHVKALELLQISLQEFQKNDRVLCDYEVNSFIKYLCIKFGDPKENVRKLAHQVFGLLIPLYDSAKLMCCLTFGLRHKLARVRGDSLSEMTSLLENDHIDRFVEVLGTVVPEVAKFVVDRDVNIKKNAGQFFSQIYLSLGPSAVDYIGKCDKSIRDVINEKFNKVHPKYLALKQSQMSFLEEHSGSDFVVAAAADSLQPLVLDEHYSVSLDRDKSFTDAADEKNLAVADDSVQSMPITTSATIPQKYTIDKELYLQAAKQVRPLPPPNLIPIDEGLLNTESTCRELSPILDYDSRRYCIENDYIENFLRVESILHALKRHNTLHDWTTIEQQLLECFSCMNNDIIIVVDHMVALENHIQDYYTRNMWLWTDALDLFNHLIDGIDINNYNHHVQHHLNHNYIETCLYQINIAIYNPKFRHTFIAEIQLKLFTFLMDLCVSETFNQIFSGDKVIEIISSVIAQLLASTPVIQSLCVIQELVQQQVENVKKIEFLLRLFWKCSHIVVNELRFYQDSELDRFVSAYYLIYSVIMETSNANENRDYFVLLDHCFSAVMKGLSQETILALDSISGDANLKSHVKATISRLGIQPVAEIACQYNPAATSGNCEKWMTTLENNVANFIDYKNSIEKLVRCHLHGVGSMAGSWSNNNHLHHVANLIKWRTSLDSLTKCATRQHLIDSKLLQDKYDMNSSSSSSTTTTLFSTPTNANRKYLSQLLDNTNSGLNLSSISFASPIASNVPPSPNVTPSSSRTTNPNLASLKARLEKIKANNT